MVVETMERETVLYRHQGSHSILLRDHEMLLDGRSPACLAWGGASKACSVELILGGQLPPPLPPPKGHVVASSTTHGSEWKPLGKTNERRHDLFNCLQAKDPPFIVSENIYFFKKEFLVVLFYSNFVSLWSLFSH